MKVAMTPGARADLEDILSFRVIHDIEILHIHHAARRPWSGQP
jgi:hypothetical protein